MDTGENQRRKLRACSPRNGFVAGVFGTMWMGILLAFLLEANGAPKPPKVRVTISKETTYITEPLRADGYPDYAAALNQRLAQGVTPENNSAVLFWEAMGPKKIDAKIRAEYFRRLGVPVLPEEGQYFQGFREYAASLAKQGGLNLSEEKIEHIYKQVQESPWEAEEFPMVAQWLQANEKPLALIIQASQRPRRYDPLVVSRLLEGEPEMLVAALLPAASHMREAVQAMQIRAMHRLGQGKAAEAWQEILTMYRLARLMAQGATLIENLVAVAIETQACQAAQRLAREGNLSAKEALAIRDTLVGLPPLPTMADKIDLGERFMYLDVVCTLARTPGTSFRLLEALEGGQSGLAGWAKRLADLLATAAGQMIDWDLLLRMGNQWYDRLVEAGRKPTPQERAEALASIDAQLQQLKSKTEDPTALVFGMFSAPRQKVSEQLGHVLIALLVPAIRHVYVAEDRAAMQRQLTICSFALAAYQAEQGRYPKQLEELVPRYLAAVPMDAFAPQKPLIYRRTEEGVILYSVGPNGKDDGGRSLDCPASEDQREGDDLVLRMQTPSSPGPKQK
ncbi:MAG: hypothetical protein NZ602_00895 [Thermoguttaceae bacterium]|nr:hypothetical protein [Thermoguttaceae bacterium]MDW8038041.1 hypothetical protein [Thermoguttaceae bacterium]